jgi:glycosyltransferase involved in cell wall biosynthesis
MTAPPARLILVDPCLDGAGSHPWQYAVAVLGAARRRGFACELVCRSTARLPADATADWRVWPVLRFPGHSKLTAFAELDRLKVDGRPRWQPPWETWARSRQRRSRVAAFAADLAPTIASLAPGDRVVIATASELDAVGLAQAIHATRPPAGIGWHLQFHGPILAPDGAVSAGTDGRISRVSRLLDEAIRLAAPHRLHFHTPTEELAAEWSLVGAAPVSVLPYPIDLPADPDAVPLLRPTAGRRLRIAMLGDARSEKNSQIAPALVNEIAAIRPLRDRLHFAIQTNPGFDPRSRREADIAVGQALEAIESIARRTPELVEPLAGPFPSAAYHRQLTAADALLLPYDQRRYRHRCSAVLLEALAAGKVAIVTGGGWMARRLQPALRAHVDHLVGLHPQAAVETFAVDAVPAGGVLTLPVAPPPGAGLAVVEVTWRALGPPALLEPPLILTLGRSATPSSAILEADSSGTAVPVVFRLGHVSPTAGPTTLTLAIPTHHQAVALSGLRIRWLHGGHASPRGNVGIVIAGADGAAEAIEELVAHADHYLAGAARAAVALRQAHAPEAVLERLLT